MIGVLQRGSVLRIHDAAIRRILGRAQRAITSLARMARWSLAFAMAASLVISALGVPAPVRAQTPPDPAARLQFIVHKVHIRDDEDLFGSGELRLLADFCPDGGNGPYVRSYPCAPGGHISLDASFSASSGDDVVLNRVSPRNGDFIAGDASIEAGLPVYAGQRYFLEAFIIDHDPAFSADPLGHVFIHVDEAHGWSLGTFTTRSIQNDGSPGDFDITVEIRRTPLPDLLVTAFSVVGGPDAQFICGQVKNAGQRPSPPAELSLSTEGTVLERFRLPALEVEGAYPHCVRRSALPAQKHNLVFSIDELRELPEMNELNNVNVTTVEADPTGTGAVAPGQPAGPDAGAARSGARIDPDAGAADSAPPSATGPGAGSSGQPSATDPGAGSSGQPTGGQADPSTDRADLIVREIRVNGRVPNGQDDCKDGKSTVTVVVRNAGPGNAGEFEVTLLVDSDDEDESVDGLAAGQEREVRFDGVTLKRGRHTLRAVVEADRADTDPNITNNAQKVSVTCTGA